jgi:hypothetical protein
MEGAAAERVGGKSWPARVNLPGRFRRDIPGLFCQARNLLIFLGGGPDDGLVVVGAGLQVAAQDADQTVGQLATAALRVTSQLNQ